MKNKLKLSDITLLAVANHQDVDQTQISLKISSQNIEFGAIKLITSAQPKIKYPDIEYVSIQPLNFLDYNRFMMKDLHKYFKTSHCLYVQSDSFVVNSNLWKKEFLEFDYIGAPWSDKVHINNLVLNMEKNPVGNGGFSLRSRKLLETTTKINFDSLKFPIKSEDVLICHYLYKKMLDNGIHFAPPKLAAQFSIEDDQHLYGQDVNSVFGFHAKHLRDYFLKEYMRRAPIGKW